MGHVDSGMQKLYFLSLSLSLYLSLPHFLSLTFSPSLSSCLSVFLSLSIPLHSSPKNKHVKHEVKEGEEICGGGVSRIYPGGMCFCMWVCACVCVHVCMCSCAYVCVQWGRLVVWKWRRGCGEVGRRRFGRGGEERWRTAVTHFSVFSFILLIRLSRSLSLTPKVSSSSALSLKMC